MKLHPVFYFVFTLWLLALAMLIRIKTRENRSYQLPPKEVVKTLRSI